MAKAEESSDRIGRIMLFAAGFTLAGIAGALGAWPFKELAGGARSAALMAREMSQTRPLILSPLEYGGARPTSIKADKAASGPSLT